MKPAVPPLEKPAPKMMLPPRMEKGESCGKCAFFDNLLGGGSRILRGTCRYQPPFQPVRQADWCSRYEKR